MIYQLRHRTTYRYDAPVTFAQCVLRLTPASSATQTELSAEVAITPKPARTQKQEGPFGERMLKVLIDQPHATLVIEARLRPLADPMRLNGCALVVVNPPPGLEAAARPACDWVVARLGSTGGQARVWGL